MLKWLLVWVYFCFVSDCTPCLEGISLPGSLLEDGFLEPGEVLFMVTGRLQSGLRGGVA